MIQRIQKQFVSDLSGEELDGNGETVRFSYGGSEYEIDLSREERLVLEQALETYVANSRRVGGRRQTRATKTPNNNASELADIRRWARENNHPVKERGRISSALREAYHAAQ